MIAEEAGEHTPCYVYNVRLSIQLWPPMSAMHHTTNPPPFPSFSQQEIDVPAREGAYITGLSLQGARWDAQAGSVERSRPREMSCPMPVMLVRAVAAEKADAQVGGRVVDSGGWMGWMGGQGAEIELAAKLTSH